MEFDKSSLANKNSKLSQARPEGAQNGFNLCLAKGNHKSADSRVDRSSDVQTPCGPDVTNQMGEHHQVSFHSDITHLFIQSSMKNKL